MWNSKIRIKYPTHLNILLLKLQQLFYGPKMINNEPKNLTTIHIVNITLTNFNNCHQVTHKHIFGLCKFDGNMHKFHQWQNAKKSQKNLKVTKVFVVQHGLLVCKVVHGDLHKNFLYFIIIHLVELNIKIHNILTFQKKLFPFVAMNFASFKVNVQNKSTNIKTKFQGTSPKVSTMFKLLNCCDGPYSEP